MSFLERGLNAAAYMMRPATHIEGVYQTYLWLRGAKEPLPPQWSCMNRALRSSGEVGTAVEEVQRIGLFRYYMDVEKTWDSLSALSYVLENTNKDEKILDAGSSLYSVILPWLYLYGYRNLVGMNSSFPGEIDHGPIAYLKGDITKSGFNDGDFGAITCLSVVEHLPDVSSLLCEANRLLKPGGLLIVSTDYWPEGVVTKGKREFGAPFNVFDRKTLEDLIQMAGIYGLQITSPPDFRVKKPVIKWHGFRYTFVVLAFRKRERI